MLRFRVEPPTEPLLVDVWRESGASLVPDRTKNVDVLFLTGNAPYTESALQPAQVSSRIPGIAAVARKQHLANVSRSLAWDFTPPALTSAAEVSEASNSPPFTWFLKDATHRGVFPLRILMSPQEAAELVNDGKHVLQARVKEPLLIDGVEFDLGVYILAALDVEGQLRYQMFDDVLLRFCSAPSITPTQAYRLTETDHQRTATVSRAWVVSHDYRSAWQMPSLAHALAQPNATALGALASHCNGMGLPWASSQKQIDEVVARTLGVVAMPEFVSSTSKRKTSRKATFDLLRFDFKLDVLASVALCDLGWSRLLPPCLLLLTPYSLLGKTYCSLLTTYSLLHTPDSLLPYYV